MDPNELLKGAVGPYGALVLALTVVVVLWRKLEQAAAVNARQQDLFEDALKLIRDDLLPLVRDVARRR